MQYIALFLKVEWEEDINGEKTAMSRNVIKRIELRGEIAEMKWNEMKYRIKKERIGEMLCKT